ncbi:MAG: monomethylamine:corrinoid methyltransferase, partial [Dehalococcoidales bacterium]
GLEFLVDTGVYCTDTERRILFTREEIEGALASGPRGDTLGEGKDAKVKPRRRPEDETTPFCSGGGGGCPISSEQIYLNTIKTYAEDPLSNGITVPALTNVDGRQIVAGSPLGVEGAIRSILLSREALRRAGRPGMPGVNVIATAVRCQEHIAAHRFGKPQTDTLEVGTFHEMKIDFDGLNKVAYALAAGNLIFAENGVILGGISGGPAGTAVVTAAYNPVDILVLRGAVQHPFPTHFELSSATRDAIWARSLATQAATRNSSLPVVNLGYSASGPMTKMSIYEYSAWVIGAVASGSSIEIASQAKGIILDHGGPMEPIFINHVAHAAAGLTRQEANRIVQGLLAKYEDNLRTPPAGKAYQECYDMASGEPVQEFVELHRELRKEMTDQFGLKFSTAFPYL